MKIADKTGQNNPQPSMEVGGSGGSQKVGSEDGV